MKSLKMFCSFTLLCASLLLFLGCKKDAPEYSLKVIAFNDTKKEIEKDVSVKVYLNTSLAERSLIEESATASNGEFVFKLERTKAIGLTFVFEKEGFFTETKTVSFKDLRTDEMNLIQQNLNMKSYITIRYINSTSQTNAKIYSVQGKLNCAECCINGFEIQPNNSATCVNNANEPYEILYVIGSQTSGTISTVAAPGETAYLDIQY